MPKPAINLGLDLAGGSFLLFEANTDDVRQAKLTQMQDQVRAEMRKDPKIDIGDISIQGGKVSFMLRDPSKVDAAREKLLAITGTGVGVTGQRQWDVAVVNSSQFVLTPTEAGINEAIDTAMGDAREVIETRINALGTRRADGGARRHQPHRRAGPRPAEPDRAQGADRPDRGARIPPGRRQCRSERSAARRSTRRRRDHALSHRAARSRCSACVMISGDMLVDAKQSIRPAERRAGRDAAAQRRRLQAASPR